MSTDANPSYPVDGSLRDQVKWLSGLTDDEIDRLGDVTDSDEPRDSAPRITTPTCITTHYAGCPCHEQAHIDELAALRAERDEWEAVAKERREQLSHEYLKREAMREDRDAYYDALHRIANTNPDPRPDGAYNISRAALIDIARRALGG
jgi:hypothetical protein